MWKAKGYEKTAVWKTDLLSAIQSHHPLQFTKPSSVVKFKILRFLISFLECYQIRMNSGRIMSEVNKGFLGDSIVPFSVVQFKRSLFFVGETETD